MSRDDPNPSPRFAVEDTQIDADGALVVDPAPQDRASKYKPFDGIQIQNASSNDIELQLNDQNENSIVLESGQSMEKEFPDIQEFSRFRVENLNSSEIVSQDLRIVYYTTGVGADKAAYNDAAANPASKIIEKFTGMNPAWF